MAQKTVSGESLQKVQNTEIRRKKQKQNTQNLFKRSNHIIGWSLGLVVALSPIIISYLAIYMHEGNTEVIKRYSEFIGDFVSSGSLLWISITLLSGSFVDLLLYGFRKKLSDQMKTWCRLFVVLSAAIEIAAAWMYFENIVEPINSSRMISVSIGSIAVFAAASGFISFKIVQEV